MKGLITAGGSGTRLDPFTKAIPKELLPIGDKSVIGHVVESMRKSGITDIVIVISSRKYAICDYFGSGECFGVNISYLIQDERLGLSHAVNKARHLFKDGDDFMVVLGDNYFSPKNILFNLKNHHEKNNSDCTVGVFETGNVERHGIIQSDGKKIVDLVEKPYKVNAPSNLAIAGMYIFNNTIFEAYDFTELGYKGEYELTDTIKQMINLYNCDVRYYEINGVHIDVGTPKDLMYANQYFLQNEYYDFGW